MYIHDNIIYNQLQTIPSEQLRTVETQLPKPSEIRVYKTEEQIRSENIYANRLSNRNSMGNYIVSLESETVLINFIPSKLMVDDASIYKIVNNSFEYFPDPVFSDALPEPNGLPDGTIFRVTGQGVLPKEDYIYYSIENGVVSKIPNYKTVEVLLYERGRSLDEIQIIEPTQFDDLLHNSIVSKFVEQGLTYEEALEEAAKFIITTPRRTVNTL